MPQADQAVARAVRQSAAALIGELAHEMNNRLATMRETVGLLEDLARAHKTAAAGTARALSSLDDQVGRALNVVRALGSVGSTLGASTGPFDVGETTAALLDLAERAARRRSQRLERAIAAGLPPAVGDPALFLCLLHRLLESRGAALGPGGSILVQVDAAGSRITVRLVPAGPSREASATEDVDLDRELAVRLGGGLVGEGGGALTIELAAAG